MLDAILDSKRREVHDLRTRYTIGQFADRLASAPPSRSLSSAIRTQTPMAVIAEIKRRSPSKGLLNAALDPTKLALAYETAGAAGISVLTDAHYFSGTVDDLTAARTATTLPILRKDFIVDEIQLYESRAIGADAVLLIVAALDRKELASLHSRAIELGLEPLVEVHSEEEAHRALEIGAAMIGINNRDLRTFDVSLDTTFRIRPLLPGNVTVISESGIRNSGDVERLRTIDVHAVLVGEHLVTSADPSSQLRELTGRGR
ncbi:MAG: indole-3-glycerol phosphate synthase TrpC [candidate division Zixibacteria bacterium]|nr:indole-3-glycerol phosphate synthase TrpC [candidate division Zixibacteria bacterium]